MSDKLKPCAICKEISEIAGRPVLCEDCTPPAFKKRRLATASSFQTEEAKKA